MSAQRLTLPCCCPAEVVLFTAGLEDYAAPICRALEHSYGGFTAKLFRPATVACDVYPCVKVRNPLALSQSASGQSQPIVKIRTDKSDNATDKQPRSN